MNVRAGRLGNEGVRVFGAASCILECGAPAPALAAAIAALMGGCAELGVVISDGTSISIGKPSHGYLIEASGCRTAARASRRATVWKRAQQPLRHRRADRSDRRRRRGGWRRRYRRQAGRRRPVGARRRRGARVHRSHQSGRDVDLLYYMRDADGKPFEADAMRVFDATRRARATAAASRIDMPADVAARQGAASPRPRRACSTIFMYEPIAQAAHRARDEDRRARGADRARAQDAQAARRQRAPRRSLARPRLLHASRPRVRLRRHRPDGAARRARGRGEGRAGRAAARRDRRARRRSRAVGAPTMLHIDALPWQLR